jgi:hypothetical protein
VTTILVGSIVQKCKSQEPRISLEEGKPIYILISDMKLGKPIYFEHESNSHAGFKYRIVTTTSEIYNMVFLERLVIDIEDNPVDIDFSKKLNLDSLFVHYKLSRETELVSIVEWVSEKCFMFRIGDELFRICIVGSFECPELIMSKVIEK